MGGWAREASQKTNNWSDLAGGGGGRGEARGGWARTGLEGRFKADFKKKLRREMGLKGGEHDSWCN